MSPTRLLAYGAALLLLWLPGACGSPPAPDPTASAAPGPTVTRTVTITGSRVEPPPASVDLPVGGRLVLVVTSDHDDSLHAHGFDVSADLRAGVPTTVALSGTTPGVYEVESHDPSLTLLTVAVR